MRGAGVRAAGMSLPELLGLNMGLRPALAAGLAVAMLAMFLVMPAAIRKLRGAGIVGRDRHKPGRPEVPEMGGLAIFVAFNLGVFAVLALGGIAPEDQLVLMASLIVCAGACVTGILDDLISLRQRFKAFIPLGFAAPLALYAVDTRMHLPLLGSVDFGLLYPLVLVPLAVACASNGFNMLEGFNGLGAGLGIILAAALSAMAILEGNLAGLALLFPLVGALGGFLYYNWFPARVFPGDTTTLLVGAALAVGAIVSQIEFWGFLLFVPHVVEFFLKARAGFDAQSFASRVGEDGVLHHEGPVRSLTHLVMLRRRVREPQLVLTMWAAEAAYAGLVLAAFLAFRSGL